jgi:hypothetical protein
MPRSQQRALAIFLAVIGGGLVIVLLALSLGGEDSEQTRRIEIPPSRATSTSTSSSTVPTSTTTTTTLAVLAVPTTTALPPITPGTAIVVNPTTPPGPPATSAPPVTAPTTTTTRPPTPAEELEALLETALGGGIPPTGTDPRVNVEFRVSDERVRVTWSLDPLLDVEAQRAAARLEAVALLRIIQGFAGLEGERVVLRATLPDPDTGDPARVVRLVFERATLDSLDFSTLDAFTVFELADESTIDPALAPAPPPTTTTSTTTTTRP